MATAATINKPAQLNLHKSDAAADQQQSAFDEASIESIGVSGKSREALLAEGIATGKDLRTWLNAVPRRAIKGVGEKAIEVVSDLCVDWYAKRALESPQIAQAVKDLAKPMGDISSVTLSSGGKSVTIDDSNRDQIIQNCDAVIEKGKSKRRNAKGATR